MNVFPEDIEDQAATKFRQALSNIADDVHTLKDRMSRAEGAGQAAEKVFAAQFEALTTKLVGEIGKQFDDQSRKHSDEMQALRSDMNRQHEETLAQFKDYDLPDAIDGVLTDRRRAFWQRARVWGPFIGFAAMLLLTIAGGGSAVDAVNAFFRLF